MKQSFNENLKPFIFIAIVLVLTAISAYPQRKFVGKVTEIVDGRTCVIQLPSGRVTAVLQYVEIPEPEQPLYQTVKEHLSKLVLGQSVEFLPRIVMRDRTAGKLLVKGVDVSQQMLRDGAAWYSVPEKSGQDEPERFVYMENESLAKTEKRGVWSVADLKPSWEFRAEQAAIEKRKTEEAMRQAVLVREKQRQQKAKVAGRPTPQVVPQVELWANVDGANDFDQPLGFGGLRAGYNPTRRIGHISTPSIFLEFANPNIVEKVDSRLFYLYRGDKTKVEDSIYMVGFIVTSKSFQFAKANNLTITADAQKISLGKAMRFTRTDYSSVSELLLYKMTRAQILKIAKSQKIGVQIGSDKGSISSESLMMINNLVNAS